MLLFRRSTDVETFYSYKREMSSRPTPPNVDKQVGYSLCMCLGLLQKSCISRSTERKRVWLSKRAASSKLLLPRVLPFRRY